MINLLLSFLVAGVTFTGFDLWLGWGPAITPAVLALIVAYILLARRSSKQLEVGLAPLEKMLSAQPPRFDKAVELLEAMKALGRWQFGVVRALDGQIGLLTYAHKGDFDKARPYLEKAYGGNWHAQAMLGAGFY